MTETEMCIGHGRDWERNVNDTIWQRDGLRMLFVISNDFPPSLSLVEDSDYDASSVCDVIYYGWELIAQTCQ